MKPEITFVKPEHFADAWALLLEYFEAVQVIQRDARDAVFKNPIWLAYVDGIAAGCIALRPLASETGEIKRLYVRPTYRRLGLAGLLLAALEAHAASSGMTELFLDSMAGMTQALAFYERSGYLPCPRYNDNPQADVFLRKQLQVITVREFQPGDEEAFWTLNEAWISKLFKLEEKDIEVLQNAQQSVLAPGGRIYMACRGSRQVGCCALLNMQSGSYELAKMGVAETERGKGVGRILLQHVIADARKLAIPRLYIETNLVLKNAIHLYEAVGFKQIQPPAPSPYQRANVFMELLLTYVS